MIADEVERMNQYAKNIQVIDPLYREGRRHFLMRAAQMHEVRAADLVANGIGHGGGLARHRPRMSVDENFNSHAIISENEEKFSRAWLTKHARVCPLCISSDQGKNSIGWETRYADACVVHGVWLVEKCTCGELLRPLRRRLSYCCHCDRKLGSIQTSAAPKSVVWLSRLLINAACHEGPGDDSLPAPFENLTLADLQTLVAVIGLYGDPNAPLRRSGTRHVERMDESWQITSLAAEVLSNWPSGFRAILEWLRKANDDGSTLRLGHRLGRLYHCLAQLTGSSQFQFVHDAIEEYLREMWPGMYVRANGRFSERRATKWMPAREVRRRLKVSATVLDDLIARGQLTAECRITATGRKRTMLESSTVLALEKSGSVLGLDLTSAADELGLGESRFRGLVEKLCPNAWKTSGGQWQVPERDIDRYRGVCHRLPLMTTLQFAEQTTIAAALKYLHLTDVALLWIAKAVLAGDGHIVPHGRHVRLSGIGAWVIDRQLVVRALRETATENPSSAGSKPVLATAQIAKRWKIKPQVVYQLLKLGELSWTARKVSGHWAKWVALKDIERFETSFVTARKIAMASGKRSLGVIQQLRGVGMEPTIGAERDCRQAFYRCGPRLSDALAKCGLQYRQRLDGTPLEPPKVPSNDYSASPLYS